MIITTTSGMGWVDDGQLERHAGSPRALRLLHFHNSNAGNDQLLAVVAALMLECLTAACKALSLANAKGKGTNGLVIRSLD